VRLSKLSTDSVKNCSMLSVTSNSKQAFWSSQQACVTIGGMGVFLFFFISLMILSKRHGFNLSKWDLRLSCIQKTLMKRVEGKC